MVSWLLGDLSAEFVPMEYMAADRQKHSADIRLAAFCR